MNKIFYNGDIITMDENNPEVEAVFVKDSKITKVGKKDDILKLKDSDTELIDLAGKTLIPAFIDAHSHFGMASTLSLMDTLAPPPVGEVSSIDDMINVMKRTIDKTPDDGVYLAFGYDHTLLKEKRQPTKFDLDKVSDKKAIIAFHISGHVGALNSVALKRFGIDENTPDPPGGFISRVPGTMEPDGYLEESAIMGLLGKAVGDPTPEQLEKRYKSGQNLYFSNGYVLAQDGAPSNGDYMGYKFTADNDILDIDVRCYPTGVEKNKWTDGGFGLKAGDKVSDIVWYSGEKLFLDGSPQARTAWVTKPYQVVNEGDDPEYRAYPIYKDDAPVIEFMIHCMKEGYQFLTHCNGDAATDQYIRCYKKALEQQKPVRDIRPVVVHCQIMRDDQMEELKKLGALLTFMSAHAFYFGDVHRMNFGEEVAAKTTNIPLAIKLGFNYTIHEDTPVLPPKPLFSIWVATNRLTRSNHVLGGDKQKITAYEALKAYTVNSAYQYFEENVRGNLVEGKYADMVILDKNLLKVNPSEIKDISVLETIKNGKTVFKK